MSNSLQQQSLLRRAAAIVSGRPAFLAALGSAIASLLLSGCAEPVTRTTHVYEAPGYPSRSPVMSTRFGTVERIDVIETEHGDSGGGAVLGALVGTVYRVFVQFDDGGHRHFDYRSLDGLHTGDRVRLQYGMLDRA